MAVVGRKFVNARERLLPVTDMLDKTVDPYVATRNAYLQRVKTRFRTVTVLQ